MLATLIIGMFYLNEGKPCYLKTQTQYNNHILITGVCFFKHFFFIC